MFAPGSGRLDGRRPIAVAYLPLSLSLSVCVYCLNIMQLDTTARDRLCGATDQAVRWIQLDS